ncbi:MAG: hypothetical protein PHQ53_14030, partial [Candidatus Krumholzibacteria bacterium]|nr:hypothetical protein [Candidatus Krumholzibacteria bacterium]
MTRPRRPPTLVLCAVAGAVLLRVILCAAAMTAPERCREPDSADYLELARNLRLTGAYARNGEPELFRTPGYPAFLALLQSGFVGPEAGLTFALLIQVAADIALCLLLWYWGANLIGRQLNGGAAAFAVVWQAAAGVSAVFACKLLSDSLYAVLLLGALTAAATAVTADERARRGNPAALTAGLLLGIGWLWRAVTGPFVIVPVAALLFRRQWRRALILSLAALLIVAPWILRNRCAAGFTGVSTVAAINLYRYNAALLLAREHGIGFAAEQARIDAELAACPDQAAAARLALRRGRAAIL